MTIFKISRLMIVILSLSLVSVAPPAHADSWKEATKAYAAYADDGARLPIKKLQSEARATFPCTKALSN